MARDTGGRSPRGKVHVYTHRGDHVDAEHAVRLLAAKHLDNSLGILVALCPRVGRHWESTNIVLDALCFQVLFVLANPCHLGMGVHDRRDAVVVNVRVSTKHAFDTDDALVLGLVSKHWSVDAVTDGVDAGDRGLKAIVHGNPALVVEANADVFKTKVLEVRSATYRNQKRIYRNGMGAMVTASKTCRK
jgi:hypothetical protein